MRVFSKIQHFLHILYTQLIEANFYRLQLLPASLPQISQAPLPEFISCQIKDPELRPVGLIKVRHGLVAQLVVFQLE